MPPTELLPTGLSELFLNATASGKLTLADRYGLFAALMDASLNDEDRRVVDRLLSAMRRGRLEIVDDLSAIAN